MDNHTYSAMIQVTSTLENDMQHHNDQGTSPESLNTFFSLLSKCKTTPGDKANTLLKDMITKRIAGRETIRKVYF